MIKEKTNDELWSFIYSLDLVDTTFGLMNVDSEICRQKMICEMEQTASKNSVLDFVLQNVG